MSMKFRTQRPESTESERSPTAADRASGVEWSLGLNIGVGIDASRHETAVSQRRVWPAVGFRALDSVRLPGEGPPRGCFMLAANGSRQELEPQEKESVQCIQRIDFERL